MVTRAQTPSSKFILLVRAYGGDRTVTPVKSRRRWFSRAGLSLAVLRPARFNHRCKRWWLQGFSIDGEKGAEERASARPERFFSFSPSLHGDNLVEEGGWADGGLTSDRHDLAHPRSKISLRRRFNVARQLCISAFVCFSNRKGGGKESFRRSCCRFE